MIQSVIQVLIGNAGVQTAIGRNRGNTKYKIFPVYADEKEEPPFTVASITGNNPNYCKDLPSRMDEVSFRLVTYSKEYSQMDTIDNALRFAIDGFRGESAGINISVRLVNQQDSQVEGKDLMARASDYIAQVKRDPA